jgi:hypothetical protein
MFSVKAPILNYPHDITVFEESRYSSIMPIPIPSFEGGIIRILKNTASEDYSWVGTGSIAGSQRHQENQHRRLKYPKLPVQFIEKKKGNDLDMIIITYSLFSLTRTSLQG